MRRLALVVLLFLLWAPGAYAWSWPVEGPVLLGFTFDPNHPYAGGQHRGIDVGAPTGTSVAAPSSGTITFAGTVPTSGKSVTIATADGYSVTLTHLGSIGVAKGASVGEGATVGTVGPSGTPELDVPYVYMGVRLTANAQGYLDPLSFLPALPPPVPVTTAVPPPSPPPAPVPAAAPPTTTTATDSPPATSTTPAATEAPPVTTISDEPVSDGTAATSTPPPETTTTEAPAPDAQSDATATTPTTDVSAPDTTVPGATVTGATTDSTPPVPEATSAPSSGAGDISEPEASAATESAGSGPPPSTSPPPPPASTPPAPTSGAAGSVASGPAAGRHAAARRPSGQPRPGLRPDRVRHARLGPTGHGRSSCAGSSARRAHAGAGRRRRCLRHPFAHPGGRAHRLALRGAGRPREPLEDGRSLCAHRSDGRAGDAEANDAPPRRPPPSHA